MANIINNLGQVLVGFRSPVLATPPPVTASTLLTSLYSVWNADTTTSTLDSSIYGVYNGDNVNDTSGNARNGTNVGGVTFTTGKVGNAFTFNGSNYVSLPTNSLSSLTGDFSVSAWVNLASLTTRQCILANYISVGTPAADIRGFRVYYGATATSNIGGIRVDIGDGTSNVVNLLSNNYLTTNTWYHIVVTRKASTGTNIYINGSLVVSNSNTINPTYTTAYPTIGTAQYLLNSFDWYMSNGSKLDAVTIWNKKLTDDEITQLYNLGTGAEYPFSGQTLPSANNQFAIDNGTLMNGCTFADGKIGKAFTFDGVNDYIKLPSNSLSFTNDFSVSFWMKLGSLGQTSYIIDSAGFNAGITTGWVLNLASGNLQFSIYNNNTLNQIAANYVLTSTSVWYHVVITSKSGYNAIYINNSLIISNTSTMRPNYVSSSYDIPYIGVFKTANTQFFYGNIDALTIWQKSLTASEVTELYNSGNGKQLTVSTPIVTNGLVLNLDSSRLSSYPNAGTTWYDISGNGNNGTMTNGPIFGTASGGTITFDGVNDYIDFGDVLDMGTKSYTINMWVKLNNTNTQTFLSKALAGMQNYRFAIGITNNKLYTFVQGNSPGQDATPYGTTTLPLNTWFMATFVIDRSSSISMYYNGVNDVLASNGTISQWNGLDFQSNNPLRIGCYTGSDNSTPISFINGAIGITQVYDRVLSQSEITQNYNATKSRFGL